MIFEAIIVDDEAPARIELVNQLEHTGRVTVVNEAVCLQEGLMKMKNQRIDVAFIDQNIAGAGTDLLPQALKEMDHVPMLIYMTAYSEVQDEPFGIEPLAYLAKPVDNEKLAAVIALMDELYARKVEVVRS